MTFFTYIWIKIIRFIKNIYKKVHFYVNITYYKIQNTLKHYRNIVTISSLSIIGCVIIVFGLWSSYKIKTFSNSAMCYQNNLIFDRNGILIGYACKRYSKYLSFNEIPNKLKESIIASEDRSFYYNLGLSLSGITRAIIWYIPSKLKSQRPIGGSTITQQLMRQLFLQQDLSFWRKIQESFLSLVVNIYWSKEKILELYVNNSYFGNNVFGFYTIAEMLFNKQINDLTNNEIAILVSMLKNPTKFSPLYHNKTFFVHSKNLVLKAMLEESIIDQKEYEEAIVEENKIVIKESFHPHNCISKEVSEYIKQYFSNYSYGGLNIYTSIDIIIQKAAEESLVAACQSLEIEQKWQGPLDTNQVLSNTAYYAIVQILDEKGNFTNHYSFKGRLNPDDIDKYQTVKPITIGDYVVVTKNSVNPDLDRRLVNVPVYNGHVTILKTGRNAGDILATYGGLTEFDQTRFGSRSVASCMKVIDTLVALEYFNDHGVILDPEQFDLLDDYAIIKDNKLVHVSQSEWSSVYHNYHHRNKTDVFAPQNWDGKYLGPLTLARAFMFSRNIPFLQLMLNHVGLDNFKKYLIKFHILTEDDKIFPATTLGCIDISPRKFGEVTAAIANKGQTVKLDLIKNISTHDNKNLFINNKEYNHEIIASENSLNQLYKCMFNCVQKGTGTRLLNAGGLKYIYAKPGTSQDNKDALCLCFVGGMVIFLAVYRNDNKSLGPNVWGAKVPVQAVKNIIEILSKLNKIKDIPLI